MRRETRNRLVVGITAVAGLVFFVWWGSFDRVRDLLLNPEAYRDSPLHLYGKVGPAYNVPFVGGLYKLADTSGSVWVITDKDSTIQGSYIYIDASYSLNQDHRIQGIKTKIETTVGRSVFEDGDLPPILTEKKRGGLLASFEAVRARR